MSIAVTAKPRCRACGSESIVKNGRTAAGRQQFHCKACGVWRLLEPSAPPVGPERKAEILHAVTRERLGLRAAERTFGVCRQTIAGWIKKKPQLCHP